MATPRNKKIWEVVQVKNRVETQGQPESETYSVPELGRILGIGRNTAYEIVRTGKIRSLRFGSRIVIPRVVVQELLNGK